MMMAAVLVFFPVMVNVTRGLVQVEPAAVELMRSYAATEWTVLRKVRVPNTLPYFFTALKVAHDAQPHRRHRRRVLRRRVAVLGRIIVQSSARLRFDITWAAILMARRAGIVLYLIVVAVERSSSRGTLRCAVDETTLRSAGAAARGDGSSGT